MKPTTINRSQQRLLEEVAKTERVIARYFKVREVAMASALAKAAPKMLTACKGMIEDLRNNCIEGDGFTLEQASVMIHDLEKIVAEAEGR